MNVRLATLAFSALACLSVANAGLGFGRCPKSVHAMKNFTLDKYAGRWFEISSFGTIFEANGKCVQVSYVPQADDTVTVINSMMDKTTQKPQFIRGSAKLSGSSDEAKLAVTLPIWKYFKKTAPLWVLDTAYNSYSLAYSCIDFYVFHYDSGWVLGRNSSLEDTGIQQKVEQVMSENGLNPLDFKPQTQDCGIIDCDHGDCHQKDEN